ncbi:Sorting nexin, cytoplasm-to-vacuole targeting pathway/endosomal sorting [Physocladia obscura]|uniref:Sorting nexin, cytoplasm-to-vacuole targeting pathway/endosomal sorting n=1 Tax=Physocladia obscura TaxID=109957 RepID=A0AAD5T3M7_9FUNG|nr:Sorting nexin, cytoplasm-to-vacuole targeting pathway/endosomal sorting [Physocladia obscura]
MSDFGDEEDLALGFEDPLRQHDFPVETVAAADLIDANVDADAADTDGNAENDALSTTVLAFQLGSQYQQQQYPQQYGPEYHNQKNRSDSTGDTHTTTVIRSTANSNSDAESGTNNDDPKEKEDDRLVAWDEQHSQQPDLGTETGMGLAASISSAAPSGVSSLVHLDRHDKNGADQAHLIGHASSHPTAYLAATTNPHLVQKAAPCCALDAFFAAAPSSLFLPPLSASDAAHSSNNNNNPVITISDTAKLSDATSTSSYVAYAIRLIVPSEFAKSNLSQNPIVYESRHRYSEFEAFNRLLRRIHPTVIVPPVPEKHSVADYAIRNPLSSTNKVKDDPKMIDARRRQLQTFLNRVAAHPLLSREHAFHGFLDPQGRSFLEILQDCGVAHFLKIKDAKKSQTGIRITDAILKNPNTHFLAAEEYTYKFGQQLSSLVKHQKRMVKHLSDSSHIQADLGSAYNGWSLTETSGGTILAPEIEALGEAIDNTVTSLNKLVHILDERVTEPLHEYEKFTTSIDKTLKWRHALHVEYETVAEALNASRNNLQKLQHEEQEAQRIAAAVRAELSGSTIGFNNHYQQQRQQPQMNTSHYGSIVGTTTHLASDDENEQENNDDDPYAETRRALSNYNTSSIHTPIANTNNQKPSFPPTSATSLLSTFNSFISPNQNFGTSNDADSTRRTNIARAQEKIQALESDRVEKLSKLSTANEAIQVDLDRFQKDKILDLRNMLLVCAVANREHAGRCLAAWKDAAAVLDGAGLGGGGSGGGGGLIEHDANEW